MLTQRKTDIVSQTLRELHLYADGTLGSDANDGLSPLTPKLTLTAVFALVPDVVRHNVCVHLSGTFNEAGLVHVDKHVEGSVQLVVDGGPATTVVFDNAGSPWAADVSSVGTLGLSTLTMTPDEWAGYWLLPSSGPAAGQQRTIQRHDATTFTPIREFSEDPGASTEFTVVRPTTELTGLLRLMFKNSGGGSGTGNIRVQNLFCSGSVCLFAKDSSGEVFFSHIITTSDGGNGGNTLSTGGIHCAGVVGLVTDRTNLVTFLQEDTTLVSNCGVTDFCAGSGPMFFGVSSAFFHGSYAPQVVHFWHSCPFIMRGSRIGIASCFSNTGSTYTPMMGGSIISYPGWATTKLGGLPWGNMAGLLCVNSGMYIGGNVDFSTPHDIGIEAYGNSYLILTSGDTPLDVPTGTAAQMGVYAHSGAQIHIDPAIFANPPTLTGTLIGDISSDAVTPLTTWAAVSAGTPASDGLEMVAVKAYSPFVRAFGL